jgi:plastocyanin
MRTRFLLLALAGFAVLGLLVAACGDDDDNGGSNATATRSAAAGTASGGGSPVDVTITATDFKFDKASISAKSGQKVNITLVNDGSAEHSFTVGDEDVAEAEGGEDADGSFTVSSSTTEFHCKYHSQMKGTITVS